MDFGFEQSTMLSISLFGDSQFWLKYQFENLSISCLEILQVQFFLFHNMNEFICIQSLDKIIHQRQPKIQNSYTPKSLLTPNTSSKQKLRGLSPTNKLHSTDKYYLFKNGTKCYQNEIKRDVQQKKMNPLTSKQQINRTEIVKEDNTFSDRLLITSFENFVNETDQKLQKLCHWMSKSPHTIQNPQPILVGNEEQVESYEQKIIKTKKILQEKRQQLKFAKQQYESNKKLLEQLKYELDQLNEDQKILEISTNNRSLKDEIVYNRQSIIKHKQILQKVNEFITKELKEQLLSQDCQFGEYVNKFNNIYMQMQITLDKQI
ncbi:unnamed protein product (macronuclear) [Paramecium tetraurelia]|uniref:Chromosome undetermined scaffold_1, whole genome shotgun sequence n=1 Tax=Paramecium tetraurelia TaxID=5888 RepID=Q6BFX6_PARTE|nr:hypothetical protein [Paramecium tetraurelia strain d4-2]XP_001423232.1 uncharacterized protein GSPATT00000269001 [Paramecium tetraurelia]CAH03444.1 hypothetical protein PTMB.246c [Paramecium tetraurelia]CAK55834.1 unnamed protein product [Paramecium tetraurelia]|eukprot:XP_001423232.1 hypothetical protein (macronuclear) [Paramecium tetraurelia strain d4-2]